MLTILKNRQKYNFSLSSNSFSSSNRTDHQKYSNSPSWSTDSKNVKIIFVGPGVQVQHSFKECKGREKKEKRPKKFVEKCNDTAFLKVRKIFSRHQWCRLCCLMTMKKLPSVYTLNVCTQNTLNRCTQRILFYNSRVHSEAFYTKKFYWK